MPPVQDPELKDALVRKKFNGKYFIGWIERQTKEGWLYVAYEDQDREELNHTEALRYARAYKVWVRRRARSAGVAGRTSANYEKQDRDYLAKQRAKHFASVVREHRKEMRQTTAIKSSSGRSNNVPATISVTVESTEQEPEFAPGSALTEFLKGKVAGLVSMLRKAYALGQIVEA